MESNYLIKTMKFANEKWVDQKYFRITNKHLSDSLAKRGVVPFKGFTMPFPTDIPEELVHHFIRGVFDGDGCVYVNYKTKRCSIEWLAPEQMGRTIQDYLIKYCGASNNKIKTSYTDANGNKIVTIRFSGNDQVPRIADWLYKDATIFLERKKTKFDEIRLSREDFFKRFRPATLKDVV